MAPAQVLSIPTASFGFRARTSDGPTRTIAAAITQKPRNHNHNQDLVVGSKLAAADHPHRRPTKSRVDVDQLVKFLYDDLHHVFDEQGIDPTAYDEEIEFRDPITKYGDIRGYLLNIALLRQFFSPQIILHWVKKVPSHFPFYYYYCYMLINYLPNYYCIHYLSEFCMLQDFN